MVQQKNVYPLIFTVKIICFLVLNKSNVYWFCYFTFDSITLPITSKKGQLDCQMHLISITFQLLKRHNTSLGIRQQQQHRPNLVVNRLIQRQNAVNAVPAVSSAGEETVPRQQQQQSRLSAHGGSLSKNLSQHLIQQKLLKREAKQLQHEQLSEVYFLSGKQSSTPLTNTEGEEADAEAGEERRRKGFLSKHSIPISNGMTSSSENSRTSSYTCLSQQLQQLQALKTSKELRQPETGNFLIVIEKNSDHYFCEYFNSEFLWKKILSTLLSTLRPFFY